LSKINRFRKAADIVFIVSLLLIIIITILPPEYKMATYTPNFLGFFWLLVCMPLMFISFLAGSIINLKKNNLKTFMLRLITLVAGLAICIGVWFYQANALGHIN
jgi:hypothetical protein